MRHLPGFLRPILLATQAVLALVTPVSGENPILQSASHWVSSWGCGVQLTEPFNLPPVPLANSTLWQFVRTTLGGKVIRVRFSNTYGTDAVTVNGAHVALSGIGSGEINTATDHALHFRGAPGIVILPGESVLLPAFDTGDHLHLNPAGYRKMADAIYLNLFR